VTVGTDEVLSGAVDAEAREHLPVDVLQHGGRGLAGEVVHGQDVWIAVAQGGELAGVPVADGPAQQVEAWPGQRLAQPAGLAVLGDARVGEPVAGPWSAAQRGAASRTAGLCR
jgi:hypothetical protein